MNEARVQYFIKSFNKTRLMTVKSEKKQIQQTLNTLRLGGLQIEVYIIILKLDFCKSFIKNDIMVVI